MNTVLKDLIHHNIWANRTLLEFCSGLDQEQLDWTAPGAFAGIRATLEHLVDSEVAYFRLMTGIEVDPTDGVTVDLTLEQIREWLALLDVHWESFIQSTTNVDQQFTATSSDSGHRFRFTHGVVLAQVFNHSNVHREQVCNILTVHGIQPPEIDAWKYAFATGRGFPETGEGE